MWDSYPIENKPEGWMELSENGWGAKRTWTEPISDADVRGVEDDIDSYLADAGLPPRPRGFRWFLRLPASVEGEKEFWRRLNEVDMQGPPMNGNLEVVLGRLDQVLGDYAVASGVDRPDGERVLLTVHGGGTQFEFAAAPTKIVEHVLAFEDVPLWDPHVDTEDDGRWRLFAARIKEAVETAADEERLLVLVDGAVSPRTVKIARESGVP